MQTDLTDKRVLITGASRGVGAALAITVAQRGADVVLNYRNKRPRAEAVAKRVRVLGRHALLMQADITVPEDVARMMRETAVEGGLDVLVLNASGGLEKNQAPDYALRLNRDAQISLAEHALPLMPKGGRIVFVTSHLAHFYGQKPVLPVMSRSLKASGQVKTRCGRIYRCLQNGASPSWWSVATSSRGRSRLNFCSGAVRGLSKRGVKRRAACRRLKRLPKP